MVNRLTALLVLAATLTACGGGDDLTGCESAMKAAHDVDDMRDTVTDIDPAIAACSTLAEFAAASERFPDALDGADPATYVSNRCADTATGALCDEVANG